MSYTSKCKIRNVRVQQQDQEKMCPKQKFQIFVFYDNLIIISIPLKNFLCKGKQEKPIYVTN